MPNLKKIFIKALESMDKKYCNVSKLNYTNVENERISSILDENKYFERPFAYEFYHQLRKLIEKNPSKLHNKVFQAEVDKGYQNCFENRKIPDFLIHKKDSNENNLCVIEFKVIRVRGRNNDNSSNKQNIINDFYKLIEFKKNPILKYKYLYSILIGDTENIEVMSNKIDEFKNKEGNNEINIIFFNTDSWKAKQKNIKF